MANPTTPPLLLSLVQNTSPTTVANWPYGGSWANTAYQWTCGFNVSVQNTSDPTFGNQYNANNVSATSTSPQWIGTGDGSFTWKITSVISQSTVTGNIVIQIEDVNQFNTYSNSSGSGYGGPDSNVGGRYFLFQVSSTLVPILTPVAPNILPTSWQTDVMGRFTANPAS